jgi:hypothetical protein
MLSSQNGIRSKPLAPRILIPGLAAINLVCPSQGRGHSGIQIGLHQRQRKSGSRPPAADTSWDRW